jgi:hypothetical protein
MSKVEQVASIGQEPAWLQYNPQPHISQTIVLKLNQA